MATVEILNEKENKNEEQAKEVNLTKEEQNDFIRANEDDFIQGLINAADYVNDDTQRIEIARNNKILFAFDIRPLSEEDYEACKKKWTKYVRNKQFGIKLPEETNSVKYRAALIYTATTVADREKLWDNKKVWESLRAKELQILSGLDVIEYCLKAGEKDKIVECIDKLSGYDNNLEELAKN
nr:MAG TPA: tail assembly chaperone protein [Caudoviricetes sp.]